MLRNADKNDSESLIHSLNQEIKNFEIVQNFISNFWVELSQGLGQIAPPRIENKLICERNDRLCYIIKNLLPLGLELTKESAAELVTVSGNQIDVVRLEF